MKVAVSVNPNLMLLDKVFNVDFENEQNKYELSATGGRHAPMIQKNINVVQFYRDYDLQKKLLLSWIHHNNQECVSKQN